MQCNGVWKWPEWRPPECRGTRRSAQVEDRDRSKNPPIAIDRHATTPQTSHVDQYISLGEVESCDMSVARFNPGGTTRDSSSASVPCSRRGPNHPTAARKFCRLDSIFAANAAILVDALLRGLLQLNHYTHYLGSRDRHVLARKAA